MENTSNTDQYIAGYLSGDLDYIKIEQMERDLLSDSEKEQQMKDFTRIWEKSAEIKNYDKLDANSDWEKVRAKMGFKTRSKRIPFRNYALRIAAIFIFAFGLAYFLSTIINNVPNVEKNDYFQIAAGETSREVTLPDNSIITINKNAKIVYNNNFGKTNRDLILEGEAFFKVQRNEELPFKVFVESSTIEVLGTSFNIKTSKESVLVSVVTGKVAFYETSEKQNRVELIKDEQSLYNSKKHSFDEKRAINKNTMAWRTGTLEFLGGEPYEEVFSYLEEYYNRKIKIETDMPIERKISAYTIKINDSLVDILNNLSHAAGGEFVVIEEGNNFIIRSNKTN